MAFKINLMFGLPTQDRDDYELTLRFVEDYLPDSINCFRYVPFPGTKLFDYCLEKGHMPIDWSFESSFFSETESWHDRPGILKDVDYSLEEEFLQKIKAISNANKDRKVLAVAEEADREPWIVFGRGHYFFSVLERLLLQSWKNLLGYVNFGEGEAQNRAYQITIPKYEYGECGSVPETVVTTTHHGHYFWNTIEPILRDDYGFTGRILSAATQDGLDVS